MFMEPAIKLYQGRTTLQYKDYITRPGNSKHLFQYERLQRILQSRFYFILPLEPVMRYDYFGR